MRDTNKLQIDISKTKELVFRRPSAHHFTAPQTLPFVEQLTITKLWRTACHVFNKATRCFQLLMEKPEMRCIYASVEQGRATHCIQWLKFAAMPKCSYVQAAMVTFKVTFLTFTGIVFGKYNKAASHNYTFGYRRIRVICRRFLLSFRVIKLYIGLSLNFVPFSCLL